MHEAEVQSVLKTLRRAGIIVVAIHQHMIGEEPGIIYPHYLGLGEELADQESLGKSCERPTE